ncbi:hypothetical protein LTR99_006926 [Exophiala xenobiotica]|uniref:Uncharacterized protein n=1 Tax=Vermiconidia calcicola TaxID=1690605 RepID=A0AAV9PYB3_9PEZI|nr:hypothetical protein LTR92_006743 [Exophiala xenobiotica]KAK5531922.1 hypothetical protein LTR25_008252 [Vermiconidia calcicola]KAK5537250.1 hypothetical protein LTR23_007461 [Chaetothyriales sp. CCFEE 6169]KAK5221251.1 hypothetical protein LTR72_006811 [Exophiala xenobiotica]KAK5269492.1 hypothetical protein LTR96_005188 [Exophiala xenobiotica]
MRVGKLWLLHCTLLPLTLATTVKAGSKVEHSHQPQARNTNNWSDWSETTTSATVSFTSTINQLPSSSSTTTACYSSVPATNTTVDEDQDDANGDDALLYLQRELYLLSPDTGIEFDCPDSNLTLYFDATIFNNVRLQEWGNTFEGGILIIPNNWTSYCGDISDWTLFGHEGEGFNFTNASEEAAYFEAIDDPSVQYAVVVLHDLLEVDNDNVSITFDAYADDFRAVLGSLSATSADLDLFTPGPIGNTTVSEIDDEDSSDDLNGYGLADLTKRSDLAKRGVPDLSKIIKIIPALTKAVGPSFEQTIRTLQLGMTLLRVKDLQPGTQNPFSDPELTYTLDLTSLPLQPGFEGYTYDLYQFFYRGQYWSEIWRTVNPKYSPPAVTQGNPSTSPPGPSLTTATTSSSSTVSVAQPSCSWSGDKQPLNKPSTGWKDMFKIDAEKLVTTGELPLPLKILNRTDDVVTVASQVMDVFSSARSVLTHVTILSSTTATSSSPTALAASTTDTGTGTSSAIASVPAQKRTVEPELPIPTVSSGMKGSNPDDSERAVRRDVAPDQGNSSFLDGCDLEFLSWNIELGFGETSIGVLPKPSISFKNYTLKNSASIRITCQEAFVNPQEVTAAQLYAIPIGGCATSPVNMLEIDAFFVLWLSGVFSTGANGSIQIDYSYSWNPINFDVELVGGQTGPNGTLDTSQAGVGIGPPSTSGFHFDYARVHGDFPDLQMAYVLSPSIQLDVVTPLVNYSRGFMMGPALDIVSHGILDLGAGTVPQTNTSSASTTSTQSSSAAVGSVVTTEPLTATTASSSNTNAAANGSSLDFLTGLNFGILWTDYTYQSLAGPLSSVFTLPSKKVSLSWLYGPVRIWTDD